MCAHLLNNKICSINLVLFKTSDFGVCVCSASAANAWATVLRIRNGRTDDDGRRLVAVKGMTTTNTFGTDACWTQTRNSRPTRRASVQRCTSKTQQCSTTSATRICGPTVGERMYSSQHTTHRASCVYRTQSVWSRSCVGKVFAIYLARTRSNNIQVKTRSEMREGTQTFSSRGCVASIRRDRVALRN